ncbi:Ig-like domain-containing protein, partial [uncultured Dokdonia sp.]|uniref:Ig-like domain-containing protein n=1 Tax=uncultured Dokdonia sp. TaxID=575653 RepID=UPI002621BF0E
MKTNYFDFKKLLLLRKEPANQTLIQKVRSAQSGAFESMMLKRMIFGAFALLFFSTFSAIAQTQAPSIQSGVTFQWSDIQDVDGNGDISGTENNRPATIQSVTVGTEVYNTFVVPSAYQLTRLGIGNAANGNNPNGNAHSVNGIILNSNEVIGTSVSATQDINDTTSAWDNAAITAFQDQNLNHYFTANPNGENICLNFDAANGNNGVPETNAQLQTLFYDPAIPSNADGIIAVTERGGNNCYYIRMIGIPAGGGPEGVLGDTFVRTSGDLRGGGFSPPASGSDYWGSGREQDNSQTIAIALFELNDIAPTGSQITRVEFVAASRDHGDGKLFILQTYAVDSQDTGCLDDTFEGDIDVVNNVPENSTYTLLSGPTPAGLDFTLNTDGTYSYTPTPGFIGEIVFDYQVCLPAPNQNVCDSATVTLTYVPLPDPPVVEFNCNDNGLTDIIITAPVGNEFQYSINGGAFQSSPIFEDLSEGDYEVLVRNAFTKCENENATIITIEDLEIDIPIDVTDVLCNGENTGAINIEVSGGTPPYTYVWSNGETTEDINGLSAGDYSVVVTDINGCTVEANVTVNEPQNPLSISGTATDILCNGEDTGSVDITVDGGTSPYTYEWSNGATTEDIED